MLVQLHQPGAEHCCIGEKEKQNGGGRLAAENG